MALTEADAEALLQRLSDQEGQPAPDVTWVDHGGSHASVRPARHLVLDRRILADADDTRFTVAHEFGHIVLGHTSSRRSGSLIGLYVGTLIAAMALATWLVVAVVGSTWVTIAPVVGWLAWLPLQRQLSLRLKQPMEHAADLYAARSGLPLTTSLVQRYEAERTRGGRILSYLFPLHPSWAERAAVTNAAFPPEGTP